MNLQMKTFISYIIINIFFIPNSFSQNDTNLLISKNHFQGKNIGISLGIQFFDNDNGTPYYHEMNRYKNSISQTYISGPYRFIPLISFKYFQSKVINHEFGFRYKRGDTPSPAWESDFKDFFGYYQFQIFPFKNIQKNRLNPFLSIQAKYTNRSFYSKLNLGFMTDTYSDKLNLYSFHLPVGFQFALNNFYVELESILNLGGFVSGKYIIHGTNLTHSSSIEVTGKYFEFFFLDKLARANLYLNILNLKFGYYFTEKKNEK